MPRYEYKVVPAPKKAGKIRGVKGTEARFAHELSTLMNDLGSDGWEYQRADTLPCEERSGLTGRTTSFQNMLVFRREIAPVEDRAPSIDAIASVHVAKPAAAPAPERFPPEQKPQMFPPEEPQPMRATEPAPRPQAVLEQTDPAPEPSQPEREGAAPVPSFRSAAHRPPEPAFTSRTHEGRTRRLGAARRPEGPTKPTLVTR